MKIAIGCDHAGPELKAEILAHLDEKGVEYQAFQALCLWACSPL